MRVGSHRIHALQWPPVIRPYDGTAPTVVAVHGMVAASASMVPLGEQLARHGCTAWIPDVPGFGYSSRPAYALDIDETADALAAWLRELGLSGVCLLGNSSGAQSAAALAQRHPDLVGSLVLLSPAVPADQRRRGLRALPFLPALKARRPPDAWRRRAALGAVGPRVLRALHRWLGAQPELTPLILAEYAAVSPARTLSTYRHALLDAVEDRLPDLHLPVLVLRGEDDGVISEAWARRVAGTVPDGRLRVVPGADHNAQYLAAQQVVDLAAPFIWAVHAGEDAPGDRVR